MFLSVGPLYLDVIVEYQVISVITSYFTAEIKF